MGCNGTKYFNVEFSIQKGLGPDRFDKVITVCLDDLPCDTTDRQMREMAVADAEAALYRSEDYPYYGKNWELKGVYDG